MYNIPVKEVETGRDLFWQSVKSHFGNKAIDILEIGVFNGKMLKSMPEGSVNIHSYTGVDPYLGTPGARYTGSYWKDRDGASSIYEQTKAFFLSKGAVLTRETSKVFFDKCNSEYDLIFVDGDHSYGEALWDMCKWFSKVKEGGLLMIDDYGNVDTPDVTKAANSFVALYKNSIGRMGFFDKTFLNNKKFIPAVSRYVYFEKASKNPMTSFSINDGSSAREVGLTMVSNARGIAIWGGVYSTQVHAVLDLMGGNISAVICGEEEVSVLGGTYGVPAVPVSEKTKQEYYLIIPNRGTKELESMLKDKYGMRDTADYFTLWFDQ